MNKPKNSPELLEALDEHYDTLIAFATRFVGPDLAPDMVQEVAMRLSGKEYEPKGALKSYLYGAVRGNCLTYLRGNRRRSEVSMTKDDGKEWEFEDENTLDDDILVAQIRQVVREEMKAIDDDGLLQEFYLLGAKQADMAEIRGIPNGTLRTRMRRLRQKLAKSPRLKSLYNSLND